LKAGEDGEQVESATIDSSLFTVIVEQQTGWKHTTEISTVNVTRVSKTVTMVTPLSFAFLIT
jgi:hypothetical protein